VHRDPKPVAEFRLPQCPLPRPGDEVCWYTDAVPHRGVLEGHGSGGKPHVRSEFGHTFVLDSFDTIRLADPSKRRGPAWDYLPVQAQVLAATASEQSSFAQLLSRPIPPGPKYADLITEIWFRGFEVFLVGGTVRDVLAGKPTHDVDLVTTIPLTIAARLLKSMYRSEPEISNANGYVRLGGTPRSGDPFIDLKMFSLIGLGSENAVFGADFSKDLLFRDFSCNAVYYDPINAALIDPSGCGIEDACAQKLNLVYDSRLRGARQMAQILIRYVKFRTRGFEATIETITRIKADFLPSISAMDRMERVRYMRAQVINKCPPAQRQEELDRFRNAFAELGGASEWSELFEPLTQQLLK
jgi:hypothetical protein